MNSRERLMIALENGRPDRLPCQVHSWMQYYLSQYLGGMDSYQANDRFGFDHVMYVHPKYQYAEKDREKWQVTRRELAQDRDGNRQWEETIQTPKGALHRTGTISPFTEWDTEYLFKGERDFELWEEFSPTPVGVDFTPLAKVRDILGDRGIVRSYPYSWYNCSPWQTFCTLIDTQSAIMLAVDNPDFVHRVLKAIEKRSLKALEMWHKPPVDLIEIGGGAGSSTVIGPRMFEEFCVPYDQRLAAALHQVGVKVVMHLCGGIMPLLDMVAATGVDGLETMTPPDMGGDCDLAGASHQVGGKLFFIGGFDQNAGFEKGTPETARRMVFECFQATRDHAGYVCAPSDHFFFGSPENLHAFVDACRECVY